MPVKQCLKWSCHVAFIIFMCVASSNACKRPLWSWHYYSSHFTAETTETEMKHIISPVSQMVAQRAWVQICLTSQPIHFTTVLFLDGIFDSELCRDERVCGQYLRHPAFYSYNLRQKSSIILTTSERVKQGKFAVNWFILGGESIPTFNS